MRNLRKTKILLLLFFLLTTGWNSYSQNCTSCDITINSISTLGLTINNGRKLCNTPAGVYTGILVLKNGALLCNDGTFAPSAASVGGSSIIYNYDTMAFPSTVVNSGQIRNFGYLYVNGDLTNSSSTGTILINEGTLHIKGNFINNNDFTNSGVLIVEGSFENSNNGNATLTNESSITIGGNFTNKNDLTNTGKFTVEGNFINTNIGSTQLDNYGTFEVKGDFGNNKIFNNYGDFSVSGTFNNSGQLSNDSTLVIEGGLTNSGSIYNSELLDISGTFENSSGGDYFVESGSLMMVDSFINSGDINATNQPYGQIRIRAYAENVGSIGAYVDICKMNDTLVWDQNSGQIDTSVTYCINNVVQTKLAIKGKVFFQGPVDPSTVTMSTELRTKNLLPSKHPFSIPPWNYHGPEAVADSSVDIPADVVDWILISIRTGPGAGNAVDTFAAFVRSNGSIAGIDGADFIERTIQTTSSNFYLVIYSRNHLPVMSGQPLTFDLGVFNINFSGGVSNAYGSSPQYWHSSGFACSWAGDADGNNSVSSNDDTKSWVNRNKKGYYPEDINMDGLVTAKDRAIIWNNKNRSSQVP